MVTKPEAMCVGTEAHGAPLLSPGPGVRTRAPCPVPGGARPPAGAKAQGLCLTGRGFVTRGELGPGRARPSLCGQEAVLWGWEPGQALCVPRRSPDTCRKLCVHCAPSPSPQGHAVPILWMTKPQVAQPLSGTSLLLWGHGDTPAEGMALVRQAGRAPAGGASRRRVSRRAQGTAGQRGACLSRPSACRSPCLCALSPSLSYWQIN